jgi:hypothetical protein
MYSNIAVTAQSPPTSDSKASHTHRQRLKLPQQHPPLAAWISEGNQAAQQLRNDKTITDYNI